MMDLPDVQNTQPEVKVGVYAGIDDLLIPVRIRTRQESFYESVGSFKVLVLVHQEKKGADMSRLASLVQSYARRMIDLDILQQVAQDAAAICEATLSYVSVKSTYFFERIAPSTGNQGLIAADVAFMCIHGLDLESPNMFSISVPVATVCPCSAELCQDGSAHNQRAVVTVSIVPRHGSFVWFEEVDECITHCASSAVYPVLKRADEMRVTQQMFASPRFVEDVARGVYAELDKRADILAFDVQVSSLESIHAHNACAFLFKDTPSQILRAFRQFIV